MCAVLFGQWFACKVLGTCSGIWFSGIFGVVLCPGITGGLSGVFLGGRVVDCRYVWRYVSVCSVCLPILYVIEGIRRWYCTGTTVRCIIARWYVCGTCALAGLLCLLLVVLRITFNCSDM